MTQEELIIGVNYPKVGDKIFWKDIAGKMHEDVVLRIEDGETQWGIKYTIYVTHNNCFVDKDDILHPSSPEVEAYLANKAKSSIIANGVYSGDNRKDGSGRFWINLDEPLNLELGQRIRINITPIND